jgi:hypothetical protein
MMYDCFYKKGAPGSGCRKLQKQPIDMKIGSSQFQVGKINDEFVCHCIA